MTLTTTPTPLAKRFRRRGVPAPARSPAPAGFTLIELLAVVTIMGLLVTVAIAGYSQMRKSLGVGTAARHVAERLELARQAAITRNVRSRYLVNSGSIQDAVVQEVSGLRDSTGNSLYQWVIEWNSLPTGVTFITNGMTLSTTPLAQVSQGSTRFTNGWTNCVSCPGWIVTPNDVNSFSGDKTCWIVEFSSEGRPAQTYTVTVARSWNTQECAYVIVDSLTGKIRTVRK